MKYRQFKSEARMTGMDMNNLRILVHICTKRGYVLIGAAVLLFLCLFYNGCDTGTAPEEDDWGELMGEDNTPPPPFTGLAGTAWQWGQSVLEFRGTDAVFRKDASKPYAWTLDAPLVDGSSGEGNITTLGHFTIDSSRAILTITDYRARGAAYMMDSALTLYPYAAAVFKRKNPGTLRIPNNTVVGTEWNVGYQNDSIERFAECQWIVFFTEDLAGNQSGSGIFKDAYTYDPSTRKGRIEFINGFQIRNNGEQLYIPSYKQYAHSMICYRVH